MPIFRSAHSSLALRKLLFAAVSITLFVTASASAHEEREAQYPPDSAQIGSVPAYRTDGPTLVVCTNDSKRLIQENETGELRRKNLKLSSQCKYTNIMDAVEASTTGTRILVLPGEYIEQPSRDVPVNDPKCADEYVESPDGHQVPSYEYQVKCPRSKNLITIAGDTDGDRKCDRRCNLQIEGTGAKPAEVLVIGDKHKQNTFRADRADGVWISNMEIRFADINAVYVMETNGFVVKDLITAQARRYGVLSFTSDHGLYDTIEAYGNGDSGVYPGSGAPGGPECSRYGIELRNINSYNNVLGYSGTAGNNVWVHDSKFHHNSTGLATDSFAAGHPGMPQHCAKWENNEIYSNNADLFNQQRIDYCRETPYPERDLSEPCPTFQVPVGTGAIIGGGNKDLVRNNHIYDNWRDGVKLLWVPAPVRGDNDPTHATDTSHDNRFIDNRMGVTPLGVTSRNGNDFWWDGEGTGNCFEGNTGPGGAPVTRKAPTFPICAMAATIFTFGDPSMTASQAPCATWNPNDNPFPPGCDWFTQPPQPE